MATDIIRKGGEILGKEANLLKIDGEVTIFGDVHGQLYDLIDIMKQIGMPSQVNGKLLFLGDYVDRGSFGIEIVLLLFTLKQSYP